MKLYEDKNKDFWYVEKDGKWFESTYEGEDDFIEIPAIKHIDHAGLVKCRLNEIDLPEWLTDCSDCDNKGFIWDDDELLECGCYHSNERNREKMLEEAYEIAERRRCSIDDDY